MKQIVKLSIICVFSLFAIETFAQFSISGVVSDENNNSLPGVNIVEQGTTNGTTTDSEGQYEINVSSESAVLVFSFVGFETQEVDVEGRSIINIQLLPTAALLNDVVVSALGFVQNRDEIGIATSVVSPEVLQRAGETTLLNSLSGKASNVRINRVNGDPGAGSSIRIRGANTIGGSGSPLIIVDGVPLNNSTSYGGGNNATGGRTGGTSQQSRLNDINPSDIASIQVLKGASAGALYGSRASNGVIVITTKNGRSNQSEINYKATMSFDLVTERIPMQSVFGQGRSGKYSSSRAESWGDYIPDRAGGEDVFDTSGEYFLAPDGTTYYPIDTKNSQKTFVEQNWDGAFQTGGFLQHDLSISGGGNKSTYFASVSQLNQDGIIRNSYYDRTSVRINNEFFATDWLTISSKSFYTNSKSNRIQQSSNTAGLMLGLLRTPPDFDGTHYIGTYVDDDGTQYEQRHRSYRRSLGQSVNPSYNNANWTVREQESTTEVERFGVVPEFDIKPTSWLNIILRGNADISTDHRIYFFPIGSAGDRSPGIFAEDVIERQEFNFNALSKALYSPSSSIDITATIGWSINSRYYSRTSGQITGFLVNSRKPTTALNSANENTSFDGSETKRLSNRLFGIVGVDLANELFLNISGGLEASSTIKGQFFYPAADVAWTLTDRLGSSSAISFAKVRGSWGKVGVQPSPHRFSTAAETGFRYSGYSDPLDISLFGGGYRLDDDLGNPNLKPEIKTEWEVGADLRFLDDALEWSFTYYDNEVEDILLFASLTPSTGFDTQYGNYGALENQGFEMDLRWYALEGRDVNVVLGGNFAKNKNEVTKLVGTGTIDLTGASVSSRAIVGQPLGVLYGTGSQTDDNGNYILDENGFPTLTKSPVVLGDPNPDWTAGFDFQVNWKNLSLTGLIEHSQGGVFSPRTLWALRRFGTIKETANLVTLQQDMVNYDGDIIPAGTTVRGNIKDFGGGPVLLDENWYRTGIGGGFGDNQAYNFSIKDATYTKLRELTLGYTVPASALGLQGAFKNITFAASGRNLFSIDNIEGIDPETNQTGVGSGLGLEYFTNPQTRSYLFSVSISY